jgi:hypothetical protein
MDRFNQLSASFLKIFVTTLIVENSFDLSPSAKIVHSIIHSLDEWGIMGKNCFISFWNARSPIFQ